MSERNVITLRQLCRCLDIDVEVAREFAEFGLYPLVPIEGEAGVETRYLDRVERVISLYRTLGINKEGIDIILDMRDEISSLQARVEELQNEVGRLKSCSAREDPAVLARMGLLIEVLE